jgi:hypothetical protein
MAISIPNRLSLEVLTMMPRKAIKNISNRDANILYSVSMNFFFMDCLFIFLLFSCFSFFHTYIYVYVWNYITMEDNINAPINSQNPISFKKGAIRMIRIITIITILL